MWNYLLLLFVGDERCRSVRRNFLEKPLLFLFPDDLPTPEMVEVYHESYDRTAGVNCHLDENLMNFDLSTAKFVDQSLFSALACFLIKESKKLFVARGVASWLRWWKLHLVCDFYNELSSENIAELFVVQEKRLLPIPKKVIYYVFQARLYGNSDDKFL